MRPPRSGLVAEVRTDRDGVQRTRWVRPDNGRPEAARPTSPRKVPAPAVAAPAGTAGSMDEPRPLPHELVGYSRIGDSLERDYGKDDGADHIEVTDRLWYEAKLAGLADMQLRSFIRAGFTDVPAMVEYAKSCRDRDFSRRNLPGIAARRAKWLTALMEAGISRETFNAANSNLGSRVSLDEMLGDFDGRADPVSLVRLCADNPAHSALLRLAGLLQRCSGLTYEHLQMIGLSRAAQLVEMIEEHLGLGVTPGDFAAAAGHEKSRHSLLGVAARPRLQARLNAVRLFGLDRALQLREPGLIAPSGGTLKANTLIKWLPADTLFEYAQYLDAVLDASLRAGTAPPGPRTLTISLRGTRNYRGLGNTRAAHVPDREETYPYFAGGLSPEQAARALEDGVSPQAAIGMHRKGIAAPVADGWL